jgi:shikimate kinase
MDGSKPIALIGFMGVGKTSLGKKLAKQLGWIFIDTDKLIEQKQGINIMQIFEKCGENHFRQLEHNLVLELKSVKNAVIATGGGLPCFHDNMIHLNSFAQTVYLKKEADQLTNHLKNKKSTRPLIAQLNEHQLHDYVEQKLKERTNFYELAQFCIDADRYALEKITFLIQSKTL